MTDTKYLFKREQTWWVKIAVPRTLRDTLGCDLRRSLHTQDLNVARAARDEIVAELRKKITEARKQQPAGQKNHGPGCDRFIEPPIGIGCEIVRREDFSDATYLLEIRAPMLAKAAQPGQFVVVISHERGERIPLTIADFDRVEGTVTLVIQAVGKSTKEMQKRCHAGGRLHSIVGPMGIPSHLDTQKVICVGGGLGVAPIYPQLRAFKESGAYVIGVVGFRTRELIFWEDKLRQYCDELIICTDDGSVGIEGRVTLGIEAALEKHPDVDRVVAIGPPIMMKACAATTLPHKVETIVSMNPIVVDGTGMCGGCRIIVGGETKFACVDGPEFDGHKVDFDDLMSRLGRFKKQESEAMATWSEAVGAQ